MLQNLKDYLGTLTIRKKIVLFLMVWLFIGAAASFSYAAYIYIMPDPPVSDSASPSSFASPLSFFAKAVQEKVTVADPRTVPSSLNGVFYTEEEASLWQGRRAMAVMVNNHVDARPQWGLSAADIVYEAVAEGGISRFLAIYHSRLPEKVGPVRSARRYYVDWAKEYDAWYAHWGGASTTNEANVYDYMRTIFVSSIDAPRVGAKEPFDRDAERRARVAIEHTAFTRLPLVYDLAYEMYPDQVRQFRPIAAWRFKEDPEESKRTAAASVEFNFWDLPDFLVKWQYDPKTNSYLRFQGGKEQIDALSNEPLRAKNIIVIFMQEIPLLDEKAHLLYKTLGRGDAKIFLDGKTIGAEWSRPNLSERTRFFDTDGAEIVFNRGQTWIEVLPAGNTITYN